MKKMSFKEVGMPTIILFSICVIVAAALAVTNLLTKDRIAQNALETEIAARQAVLEGTEYELISEENGVSVYAVLVSELPTASVENVTATDVTPTDISTTDTVRYRLWTGVNSEPEGIYFAVSSADLSNTDISFTDVSFTDISATDIVSDSDVQYIIGYVAVASSKGYGDNIQIMIGVNLNLEITGIEILSQSETAGLGANCENTSWLAQFVGKSGTLAVSKDGGDIDAITAATITSRAVTSAVNKALAQVAEIEGRMNVQ